MVDSGKNIFATLFSDKVQYTNADEDEDEEFLPLRDGREYSQRINDSEFQRKCRRGNKLSLFCGIVAAAVCIPLFLKLGSYSDKISRTGALVAGTVAALAAIGIGIFFQVRYVKRRSWEGEITGKRTQKTRKRLYLDGSLKKTEVTLYILKAQEEDGHVHEIAYIIRPDIYDYFSVGEKIKKNGSLKIYEKLDKSKDKIIFCSVCLAKNTAEDDFCTSCKFPLLK